MAPTKKCDKTTTKQTTLTQVNGLMTVGVISFKESAMDLGWGR
jgi:hypothetical protein